MNKPSVLNGFEPIDVVVNNFTKTVIKVMRDNIVVGRVGQTEWGNKERWVRLLSNDQRNTCFDNHLTYPFKWCFNKLVVIFKKGGRMNCGNYRGLSIGDTLAKLYGKILCNRLKLWMDIDRCQAGAQEKRGCTEHILALRMIIDYAKKRKEKTVYIIC